MLHRNAKLVGKTGHILTPLARLPKPKARADHGQPWAASLRPAPTRRRRARDLYAVVNASRDASTDALLASYVAAVDRDQAPAAAEAEALAREASLAADAHDAALKEARQAAANARTRARPWRTRCWTRSVP